jgi:glyoxalase superfamily protein
MAALPWRPMVTTVQVTFDCADPVGLARFWVEALQYVLQPPPPGFESWDAFADQIGMPEDARASIAAAVDPEGAGPRLLFLRVPEAKSVKNRLHLDLHVVAPGTPMDERRAALATRAGELTALGATEVGPVEEYGQYWIVMADPEGNEFCIA